MLPADSYYSAADPRCPSHLRQRVRNDRQGAGGETPPPSKTRWEYPPWGRSVPGHHRCPPVIF